MAKKQGILYVFDIENKQEQYAKCLEFISVLYHTDTGMTNEQRLSRIRTLANEIKIFGDFAPDLAKIYYEQPMISKGQMQNTIVSGAKRVEAEKIQKSILSNDPSILHFHIRIHHLMNDRNLTSNLLNLQYLALFFQRIKQIKQFNISKRLSVFIVPLSGEYFPFMNNKGDVDFETCQIAAHYLRLLSKEYTGIIYGVQQKKKEVVVRALDFTDSKRFVDYFPLIPMNERTYAILFEEPLDPTTFEKLYALKARQRFQKAADEDPYAAMNSFILETAFNQLNSTMSSFTPQNKKRVLDIICNELSEVFNDNQLSAISFAVFMFTLRHETVNNQVLDEEVRLVTQQNLEFAIELCSGLRQLAQNTLQHSVSHEGVFSFYLEHSNNGTTANDELKVFLSDFNDKQSFIDNFVINLQEECRYTENDELKNSYLALIDRKDSISLGDFFGEYGVNSATETWKHFRCSDSSAHIGLMLFSLVMQRCKGQITIINNTKFQVNYKNIFSCSYADDSQETKTVLNASQCMIPGTQLVLSIPVGAIEAIHPAGMGQLSLPCSVHEDYDTFAQYLDYQPSQIKFELQYFMELLKNTDLDSSMLFQKLSTANASYKFQIIQCWEKYWRKKAISFFANQTDDERPRVFYLDFSELPHQIMASADQIEIFIKGFINAMDAICPRNHTLLLAFTKVPTTFLWIFRQLSCVLAPKAFPLGLQLYVVEEDNEKSIHLFGDSFSKAISNAYILSMEQGTQGFHVQEVNHASLLYERIMGAESKNNRKSGAADDFEVFVCPFDTILLADSEDKLSIFDKRILLHADHPIDDFPSGCKLDKIHMRLGSKVHIHAFYEMAYLFYRTTVANRVAFEILRNLIVNQSSNMIDLQNDDLLYYGYASYSKALLTSLQEITLAYRRKPLQDMRDKEKDSNRKKQIQNKINGLRSHLALASYQHNLQTEFQAAETELYFDFYNSYIGENIGISRVRINKPIKIIQVVPISSTLTTFGKMELRMQAAVERQQNEFVTAARYTIFWVTDSNAKSLETPCEDTEDRYWSKVFLSERKIQLNPRAFQLQGDIFYFMRAPVVWEDPLDCKLCYPDDVIGEVPLVETDQTSTVPSQQLRSRRNTTLHTKEIDHLENDQRLLALKNCVNYGHFRREKNHFQFYLETQSYFNQVSDRLPQWLRGLREKDEIVCDPVSPMLNIIFSPEHTTNVGFAQYVNNFYFMGSAEVVCINEDKEYRSNFRCEHTALIHTIEALLNAESDREVLPVQFYFVDDTIISGDTFHKANSFLRSLIPDRYQSLFPANLIRKCFLLVDRLSEESKRSYVKNVEKDFISYLHIDLSNMRTQGDSCVICKLKNISETLLKRSATQKIAEHWYTKAKQYSVHPYNKYVQNPTQSDSGAFRKLVLSHISQNVIFNDNNYFELGDVFDSILAILAELLGKKSNLNASFQYELLLDEVRKNESITSITDFLKLISRPFFSFDFKVRLQVLTFMIIFAEFILDGEVFDEDFLKKRLKKCDNQYKGFLEEEGRVKETIRIIRHIRSQYLKSKDSQIAFIQDCLINNLVELRSTYMMRKSTIEKMYRFLLVKTNDGSLEEHKNAEAFWMEYAAGLHKILDCSSDETKAIWLENLLVKGEEYHSTKKAKQDEKVFSPKDIYYVVTDGVNAQRDHAFKHFCQELFLQNNRILFDALEHYQKNQGKEGAYSNEYWTQWQELNKCGMNDEISPSAEELALFNTIAAISTGTISEQKVKARYDDLLCKIVEMANKKYGFSGIDIALLTSLQLNKKENKEDFRISDLDFVSWRLDSTTDSYFNKYEIKRKLLQAYSNECDGYSLNRYGYCVQISDSASPSAFVYFKSELYPIVPVYLYFSFKESERNEPDTFLMKLFLRDILSYRYRLLKTLKNDFAGDIFPKYAHTAGEKSILAHEKATSHNTTGDDRITLDIFVNPKSMAKYDVLDSNQVQKWLLLHNYTNAQIAKLHNRSYRQSEEYDTSGNFPLPPPLYPSRVTSAEMTDLSWFERPLRSFSDLRLLEDGRFNLLDSVVSLRYNQVINAKFVVNSISNESYNIEYFKNILIDIIISAIKFSSTRVSYLERIDGYLKNNSLLCHKELLTEAEKRQIEQQMCVIECDIEQTETDAFDYLVIRNHVNKLAHELFDWKTHNQIIMARLENPIDYADGHMSLLTISQYIEGLWPEKQQRKTQFAYVEHEGKLYFETKLPVIQKKEEK